MAIINFAQNTFRSDGDQFGVPRQKYNFECRLHPINGQPMVFRKVTSATFPGFSFENVIMNQYNKKRVVQTRLNYSQVTINFYDTFDDQWLKVMRDYLSHYYNNGEGIDDDSDDNNANTVVQHFRTSKGLTPATDRYFFHSVKIIQNGYRQQYRETTLVRPTIIDISGDTLDYGSSDPVMIGVVFQPEHIVVESKNGTIEI